MGACSSPKYLSKPVDFKYRLKGLVFKVQFEDYSKLLGEIIEVDSESITVLPVDPPGFEIITISKNQIKSAEIIVSSTSDDPKGISTWAGLINLGSIGHGIYAVATLPINLLVTIPIANDAASGTYRIKCPGDISWSEINKFARFPQGIPKNIDPKDIE